MKVVLNKCFGGFSIADWAVKEIGALDKYDVDRQADELIQLIEAEGSSEVSGPFAKLKVVEIPDISTDWEINDYDGYETITYVVGGKLYHI